MNIFLNCYNPIVYMSQFGENAFHKAVTDGNVEIVTLLINKGCDINICGTSVSYIIRSILNYYIKFSNNLMQCKYSALSYAASYDHLEMVKLLLDICDISIRDNVCQMNQNTSE